MMQPESTSLWGDLLTAAAGSAVLAAAAWGAAGGATSALVVRVSLANAIRQVVIGALAAAGMGSGAGAILVAWLGLPGEMVAAIGAGSSISYLTGVFGPALFSLVLQRITGGRLPGEPDGGDQ
ncbi:hypothetical protein U879_03805 [Defluviimonas sp. 20V17]|uniref:Uncharacterized protein n=1 Tax=Allgaiera indica TaxID=765699 RepID=A0AAN4UUD9_9RHOB|nr:hypothetical protein [Allgaiera indica]KDB04998.1 hypothetical protein U879_03805 [Defluviimonas sp. 20V17]GHE05466.1 hypothetical protein GCM10008024_36390 [Allgaiera indica]SDX71523.1 hypothetical protein SAMN05444006_1267 [Allgaiera indica]